MTDQDIAQIRRQLEDELGELPSVPRIIAPNDAEAPDPETLTPEVLARRIDHTALKPETTETDIQQLCREAQEYGFGAVCVNPSYVSEATEALRDASTHVCTVAGFPLGATTAHAKAQEAEEAVQAGADEVDMVLNVGKLKSGRPGDVAEDIHTVVAAVRDTERDALVKVILETVLLTEEEKVVACVIARRAGADFVKTSTGFAAQGATESDVALMRRVVGDELGVKAAGGVGSFAAARGMIASGASRIGASGSVAIMEGTASQANY